MDQKKKIDSQVEKENPFQSIGYVRLPDAREVMKKMEKYPRAEKPSPLLEEFMKKQLESK